MAPVTLAWRFALLTCGVVFPATACIPRILPVRIANPDSAGQVSFTGLRAMLDSQHVVRLLAIHGMGTHDSTYADKFRKGLRKKLGFKPGGQCRTVDEMTNEYGAKSTVQRCVYGDSVARQLRVYILTWSQVTEHFENELLQPDWKKYGADRVRLNRSLKEKLIDKGFSDAMLYVGKFGPNMAATVEQGICVLLTDKKQLNRKCDLRDAATWTADSTRGHISTGASPIVLVSHSLGSMMALETVGRMLGPGVVPEYINRDWPDTLVAAVGARAFLKDLQSVALLANQLPLLHLARIRERPDEPLDNFLRLSRFIADRPRPLPVVAFNDPNDLLTFPIPKGWRNRIAPTGGDRLRIINVRVTNARYRWLGVAVNPEPAHTNYWESKTVIGYLVSGR